MLLLAKINFESPLFWAVVIGWIISVTLHEFAHGVTAYLGGDYTIRERGGLTLNPLQYVDPLFSIILPVIFLMMGGIPLPGGVTYVRSELLRNRFWQTAVSLAGPAMNGLLFLGCLIPLLPRFDWIGADPTPFQQFLGASAVLQFLSMTLNLIPCPPLDGFNAIRIFLPRDLQEKLMNPQLRNMLMLGLFIVLFSTNVILAQFVRAMLWVVTHFGGDQYTQYFLLSSYDAALFGQ